MDCKELNNSAITLQKNLAERSVNTQCFNILNWTFKIHGERQSGYLSLRIRRKTFEKGNRTKINLPICFNQKIYRLKVKKKQ